MKELSNMTRSDHLQRYSVLERMAHSLRRYGMAINDPAFTDAYEKAAEEIDGLKNDHQLEMF